MNTDMTLLFTADLLGQIHFKGRGTDIDSLKHSKAYLILELPAPS